MAHYEAERMELATRDAVSKAICREIQAGRGIEGGVYLDLTPIPAELFQFRFPDLLQLFRNHGVDLQKQWIPVATAAHFFMGGVVIDKGCQTSIPGLFAAGEVIGGFHGASYHSGTGIGKALIFGRIAGKSAANRYFFPPPAQAQKLGCPSFFLLLFLFLLLNLHYFIH